MSSDGSSRSITSRLHLQLPGIDRRKHRCETIRQAPLSAASLLKFVLRLPPGVINIVTGDRVTGEVLVRDPRVKRIAFIGSVASGMAIQKAAASRQVKHVSLELGGKNPFIVCEDANLDDAIKAATG